MSPLERLAVRSHEVPCLTKGLALPCWIVNQPNKGTGYGFVSINNRPHLAHRVAYLALIGDIPEGLVPDHLCRNRACWNPWHLEPVTAQINARRGQAGPAARARNLAKTHCVQGHPYDAENTYEHPRGQRVCRTCRRETQARYAQRKARGEMWTRPMQCRNGHEFTDENTYLSPDGVRACRTCENERRRLAYAARNKPWAKPTHCRNGHEFTDENTYRRHRGEGEGRRCRTCVNESRRVRAARRNAEGGSQ